MDLELINSREFAKRVVNYNNDTKIQFELQQIYYELFKKNFRVNCGSCIKQAYVEIREKLNTKINQPKKTMAQFELKTGSTGMSKQIHMDNEIITNDNLTDSKALQILKKLPGHIVTFEKFPANWRELINGKEIKKEFIFEEPEEQFEPVKKTEKEIIEIPKAKKVLKKSKKRK